MLDPDGKQLVCEIFYLLGTILIFLDLRIQDAYVSNWSWLTTVLTVNLKLPTLKISCLRATGFLKNNPKGQPKNYPQDYFACLKLDEDLIGSY